MVPAVQRESPALAGPAGDGFAPERGINGEGVKIRVLTVGNDAHQRGDAVPVKKGLHPRPILCIHFFARVVQPHKVCHLRPSSLHSVFNMIHQSSSPFKRWRSFLCGNTAENVQMIKNLRILLQTAPAEFDTGDAPY